MSIRKMPRSNGYGVRQPDCGTTTAPEHASWDLPQPKLPDPPELELFLAAHRRNMETLSAVDRIALEGAQAVSRRRMEIMQRTASGLAETVRRLVRLDNGPRDADGGRADLLKVACERDISDAREIGDLIRLASGEAMELLNRRLGEALDGIDALAGANGDARH